MYDFYQAKDMLKNRELKVRYLPEFEKTAKWELPEPYSKLRPNFLGIDPSN